MIYNRRNLTAMPGGCPSANLRRIIHHLMVLRCDAAGARARRGQRVAYRMTVQHKVRRSWLLVPVSDAERVANAAAAGADVVVLDLAEFVAEADKPAARDGIVSALAAVKTGGAEVFVQIDPELMLADLTAAVHPGIAGVIISRLETAEQIADADAIIGQLEGRQGLLPDSVEIVAALETAAGNHNGYAIATASRRITALTLGRADLVMDLRPEPSGEIHLMQYLMQRLVTLAGAAGKTPLGAWWRAPDRGLLATPANTLSAAQRGRAIGFKGSFCVLDDQVGPLNAGFTPSADELAAAQAVVASADAGVAPDDGRILSPGIIQQYAGVAEWAAAIATREEFKNAAVEGRPIPVP